MVVFNLDMSDLSISNATSQSVSICFQVDSLLKLYILLRIFSSSFNCIERQKRMIDGSAGFARFPSSSLTFWRVFWEPSNLNIINTSKKTFYWSSVWILREDRTRFKKNHLTNELFINLKSWWNETKQFKKSSSYFAYIIFPAGGI